MATCTISRAALWSLLIAVALAVSSFSAPVAATRTRHAHGGLRVGFYSHTCPRVEDVVYNSIHQSYKKNKAVAPGILRIAFHDCFVRGCDASVLLVGPNTEKEAVINMGLQPAAFNALDAAKIAVNKACPGVVSAADVIQFAARDSVTLAGGLRWDVPAGRRDGRVSLIAEAGENLPTPNMTVPDLVAVFQRKGLNAEQLVVLSGAHTIGRAPCLTFDNRVQTSPVDPTLAPSFAEQLKKRCPMARIARTQVDLDSTAHKFDSQYFKDILRHRGLLTSDQSLIEDKRTKGAVHSNLVSQEFYRNFGKAMVAMSKIEVLTGSNGEIRSHIAYVN